LLDQIGVSGNITSTGFGILKRNMKP
jgi:hypothetical protein